MNRGNYRYPEMVQYSEKVQRSTQLEQNMEA
jgi:hypothetical protein